MIEPWLRPACLRFRGTLLAFVDRRERGPLIEPALEHLATCRRCEAELTTLALTIHALRQIGAGATAKAVPDGAWPRLRARIERSRQRAGETAWRWRLTLSGSVASALIVAALVAPAAGDVGSWASGGREPTGYSASEVEVQEQVVENAFIAASRTGTLTNGSPGASEATAVIRNYPDGIRPERKEVEPPRPSRRVPAAS
jgi:anti-sigma factor RsiW